MEINLQDRPLLISGQYNDRINGYVLYYNPLGYGGVTIVDAQSQKPLSLCDGNRTVEQIGSLDGRVANEVLGEVQVLAAREVVSISGEFTRELHMGIRGKSSISCWLHLTNNCNLACSYCYIHKSHGNMTFETGKMVIDKMLESCGNHNIGKMNIKFAGGEPLLRFDLLKQLVEYSQHVRGEVEVTYTLLTNAVLVTEPIADYLRNQRIGVGVSLDGVGPVNDTNRLDKRGVGSYNRVLKGLNVLKESGIIPSIMTTVSSTNFPHLEELTKFILEGGYRFRFSLERDCVSGKPGLLGHGQELIEALHRCYDYVEGHLPKEDFTKLHMFGDTNFQHPAKRACGAGNSFFSVGHDRKLGVCGLGLAEPFSVLDANGDVLDIVKSFNYELATSVASNYQGCMRCIWRKSCAGGCPLQTKATYGQFDRPSPYCEVYKQILPRVLRVKGLQMIREFEFEPDA